MPQLILNYHRIAPPGERAVGPYSEYVTHYETFIAQLRLISGLAIQVAPIGHSSKNDELSVAFTFDDGHKSDLTIVKPLLQQFGFPATFFPVVDLLGTDGYLSTMDLQTIAQAGFTVGSHGKSHGHLSRLQTTELKHELIASKNQLENLIGRKVDQMALPYGAYNKVVISEAMDAGYEQIFSTQFGYVNLNQQPICRWNIKQSLSLGEMEAVLLANKKTHFVRHINSWGSRRISVMKDRIYTRNL